MRILIPAAIALAVMVGIASADSLSPQTVKPAGTSAAQAQAVQGVTSGVPVPISGSVTVSSAAVTQSTSPWVTQDNHTTASAPLSCELSDGGAFYTGAKTGQLPTALDGSGFLKTHEQGTATVSGTVGVSNSFALDTSVNGLLLAQGSTTSGQKGPLTQAAVNNSPPTYIDATTAPLTMKTNGDLRVSSDISKVAGTNTVTGGVAGTLGVGGLAAEGAAISGNPVYSAGRGFNAIAFAPRYCDKIIAVTTLSTTATVQQIAAVAGQKIYICGYLILASTATTGVQLKWVEGTGANCVTGQANVTPAIFTTPTAAPATANFTLGPFGSPGIPWMATASDALCINQSATANATTLSGVIFYTQN